MKQSRTFMYLLRGTQQFEFLYGSLRTSTEQAHVSWIHALVETSSSSASGGSRKLPHAFSIHKKSMN